MGTGGNFLLWNRSLFVQVTFGIPVIAVAKSLFDRKLSAIGWFSFAYKKSNIYPKGVFTPDATNPRKASQTTCKRKLLITSYSPWSGKKCELLFTLYRKINSPIQFPAREKFYFIFWGKNRFTLCRITMQLISRSHLRKIWKLAS